MGLNRREFLKLGSAAAALALIAPNNMASTRSRPSFGLSHDMLFRPWGGAGGPGVLSLDELKTFKDHGIDNIRMMTYWNNVQPEDKPLTSSMTPGLAHMDLQVELAYKAGIDMTLDFIWAPAWATEGRYVLETWGCMDHKSIPNWNEKDPVCQNPLPAFPTEKFVDFVKFTLSRYVGVVTSAEGWNEPQYKVFFPYRDANGDPDRRYLVERVQLPFYNAVKSVSKDIRVVGPVETHHGYLRDNLLLEKEYGTLFDIISIHEYGMPWWTPDERYPDCLFYRLDNWFKPVLDELGNGREVWVTESGITAYDEPGQSTFKNYEELISTTADRAIQAGHAGRTQEWWDLLQETKRYKKELSAIRAPKRLQMADEFMGGFLKRQNDPAALQVDRVYLHQVRSHPSIERDCMEKDPDTYSLMFCDGTPTPVLARMKEYLLPGRRRAVGR